jgi:hypothetical protein
MELMLYVLVIDQVSHSSSFLVLPNLCYNCVQAIHYFQHYRSDKFFIKVAVSIAIVCNTITTVGGCTDTYIVSAIAIYLIALLDPCAEYCHLSR